MHFIYELVANGRNKSVRLQHGEEIVEFPIEKYRNFVSNEFVFGDINRVLAKLNKETQDELFELYKEANMDFITISDFYKLSDELRNKLKRIGELVPYDLVDNQVKSDRDFWIPPDPKELAPKLEINLTAFEDERVEGNEEESSDEREEFINRLTYTLDDYEDLNALIIYIKLYLPILSQFNIVVKNEVDDLFTCMATIELLDKTEMVTRAGWLRLQVYVQHFWAGRKKNETLNPAILLKGLSEEQVVTWVIAELIYRRLIPIGVSHRGQRVEDKDRPNFIKGLFHNAEGCVKVLTTNPKNERYENKGANQFDGEDGEQISKLEMIRVVEEFDSTALVAMNVFLSDLNHLINRFDPRLTREMVEAIPYSQLHHRSYNEVRKAVMGWICYRGTSSEGKINGILVSPAIIDYIDDNAYRNLYRITIALLKLWAFDSLAHIASCRVLRDSPREAIFNALQITAEQVKMLKDIYPHEIESNRVKGESKRNSSYVIQYCTAVQSDIAGSVIEEFPSMVRSVCQNDIKYNLVELIIFMHQHGHIY